MSDLYSIPVYGVKVSLTHIRVVMPFKETPSDTWWSIVMCDTREPVVLHVPRPASLPDSMWKAMVVQQQAAYDSLLVAWRAADGVDEAREWRRFSKHWDSVVAASDRITSNADKQRAWDIWQTALMLRPPKG